jgi:hypothetical protein
MICSYLLVFAAEASQRGVRKSPETKQSPHTRRVRGRKSDRDSIRAPPADHDGIDRAAARGRGIPACRAPKVVVRPTVAGQRRTSTGFPSPTSDIRLWAMRLDPRPAEVNGVDLHEGVCRLGLDAKASKPGPHCCCPMAPNSSRLRGAHRPLCPLRLLCAPCLSDLLRRRPQPGDPPVSGLLDSYLHGVTRGAAAQVFRQTTQRSSRHRRCGSSDR